MEDLLHTLYLVLMIPVYFLESLVNLFIPKSWKAKSVSGETVLITGAGNGIGRGLACRFAKLGCSVVLWDVDEKGNVATAKMIKESGGKAYAYTCDLTKRDEVYRVADLVKREVGAVTILVNNAGVVSGNKLLDIPDHLIQRTFDVNALAHFWTTKAFLPDMISKSKGHIVNIASVLGKSGYYKLTDYCASKFAAVGFTESLRLELDYDGYDQFVHTTLVCPYHITTGMFAGLRHSRFLPSLTPEYTCDCIIAGVLANDSIVYIPSHLGFGMFFLRMLPWKVSNAIGEMTGLNRSMETFTGRSKEN